MSDKQWDIKCQAMFLAIHAASRLAKEIGMDVDEMLRVYLLRMGLPSTYTTESETHCKRQTPTPQPVILVPSDPGPGNGGRDAVTPPT